MGWTAEETRLVGLVLGGVLIVFGVAVVLYDNYRRRLPADPEDRRDRFFGVCLLMVFVVTAWSAWRYATAADTLAEISAGVWWIGGILFWGGLAVLRGRQGGGVTEPKR
ncbi:MAG: hypothetical protein KDE14_04835 [Rhodobacteraceae bacterium]|nr:hypothetical protein [Paracoccaceae bacterium]